MPRIKNQMAACAAAWIVGAGWPLMGWAEMVVPLMPVPASTPALAGNPAGLLQLYQQAKIEDPDFGAATAAYRAGLTQRAIARAGLLPSVSASLSSTRNNYGLATPGNRWTDYDYTARVNTIELSQTIFDWEKISAYNEGVARALYAEAAFAEARADLVLRVAQGYFGYLLALDNVDLAEAQKQALAQQRLQAGKLYQAGVGTITDVEETKARHQLAEAQLLTANSALEVQRRTLEKMTGTLSVGIRRVVGQLALTPPAPAALQAWLDSAAEQNLHVLSQRINLKVAEAQIQRARAGHLPSLSLVASRQKGSDPSYFASSDATTRIGLQLTIPLYEGGRVSALTEQAVQQKEKARNELESAVRDSQVKTSQAYLGVVNGIAQVEALQQALKSSETTLKGMEVGQRNGFRTNTDVLNAQQQLFSVQRDLQRERYNYVLSRLQLGAAVGTLSDQDVDLVDRLIAPR
jgi:outer membrane protein